MVLHTSSSSTQHSPAYSDELAALKEDLRSATEDLRILRLQQNTRDSLADPMLLSAARSEAKNVATREQETKRRLDVMRQESIEHAHRLSLRKEQHELRMENLRKAAVDETAEKAQNRLLRLQKLVPIDKTGSAEDHGGESSPQQSGGGPPLDGSMCRSSVSLSLSSFANLFRRK